MEERGCSVKLCKIGTVVVSKQLPNPVATEMRNGNCVTSTKANVVANLYMRGTISAQPRDKTHSDHVFLHRHIQCWMLLGGHMQ